jgi:hypothetical protein
MKDTLVAGEPIGARLRAFGELSLRRNPNGGYRVSARFDREFGAPLLRALMRVEAELLTEDADLIGKADTQLRTPEERRADALVALSLRVADARTSER